MLLPNWQSEMLQQLNRCINIDTPTFLELLLGNNFLGGIILGNRRTWRHRFSEDLWRQEMFGQLLVNLHFTVVLIKLQLGNPLDEALSLMINLLQLRPASGYDARKLEEANLAVLFAMLALSAFAGTGVPIWQKPDVPVAKRGIVEVDLVVVNGFIGIFPSGCLNNVLALDLEEDVVGRKRSHWLLGNGIDAVWDCGPAGDGR